MKQEFNIIDLSQYLFSKIKLIVISMTICSIILVTYSLSLENQYTSTSVLAPVKKSEAPDGSASIAGLGASLGVGSISKLIGGSLVDDKDIYIATFRSKSFFEEFIDEALLINLFAVKKYDPISKNIIIDPKIYNSKTQEWVRNPSGPYYSSKPTIEEAFIEFNNKFSLKENKRTFMVEVAFTHKSPIVAQDTLSGFINLLNAHLREKSIMLSQQSIAYLKEELVANNLLEIEPGITQLIIQNIQKNMFAEIKKDFAYDYINYPQLPELKSAPSRAVICIIGFLAFFIILISTMSINFYFKVHRELQ